MNTDKSKKNQCESVLISVQILLGVISDKVFNGPSANEIAITWSLKAPELG